MDLLRRSLAPVGSGAWEEIDEQAANTLKGNLSARRLVDFSGPHGWDCGGVNTGRLNTVTNASEGKVSYGIRQMLPLTETRLHFSLDQWELDNVDRGAADADLDPVANAAAEAAAFEEDAIYNGLDKGCIEGIISSTPNKAVKLPRQAGQYQAAVEDAILTLQQKGIGGPYALVLDSSAYKTLMAGDDKGYPLIKRIGSMVEGGVHWSPAVRGGVLVSKRGGDYELTVGQDFAIGYQSSTTKNVKLFLTETFTFRVLEPAAAVKMTKS